MPRGRRSSELWLALLLASGCGSSPTVGMDAGPTDARAADASRDASTWDAAEADATSARCEPPAERPTTCNLRQELCDRRYDEVAYATSHNAMSNLEERWLAPNQSFTIRHQLEDGVRALMLDTHYFRDQSVLCHNICTAGEKPLAEGLFEIAEFLRCHPSEVVSILFESYISAEDTRAAFVASGLDVYVHVQSPAAPWPTLGQLIASGERLVVFTDRDGDAWPGYHDLWAWAFDTPFHAEAPDQLRCELGRGTMGNDLFILNHFLTAPLAAPSLAETVNHDPFLSERALACRDWAGQLPNFLTVDFEDIGDVMHATDVLNGFP